MQNAVQLIRNEEFDKIRVVIIGDEVWFVAVDVCRVLDLKNPTKAIKQLDDDEKKIINLKEYPNYWLGYSEKGNPNVNVVNESGLYSLIFMSRKPNAKKFRKWVTSEVLPSIRKYGYYKVENSKYPLALDEFEKDGLLFFRPTKKFKDRDSYYKAYVEKTVEWEEKYPDGDYEVAAITQEYNEEGELIITYCIGFNPNPQKTDKN